jgi:RNA polymerase primary sigma factor
MEDCISTRNPRFERCERQDIADLVHQGRAYVPAVARRYAGNGRDLDELIAAGNLGLVEAALRFDPSRNIRFLTYADWWVRKCILEAIETLSGPVRLPRYRSEMIRLLKRATARWTARHGVAPTRDELAKLTGLSPARIERMRSLEPRAISLDQPTHADRTQPLGESIRDDRAVSPQQSLIRRDLGQRMRRELATLRPIEKSVIRLRFGTDGEEPRTLREAARILGLSRERIRQIELRALLEIRRRVV